VLPLDTLPGTANRQAQNLLNHLGAALVFVALFKALSQNHAVHVRSRKSSIIKGSQSNEHYHISELLVLCVDTICDYLHLNKENQVSFQALEFYKKNCNFLRLFTIA
jgi:hypothetical protein